MEQKTIYQKIAKVQNKIGKMSKDKENPFYNSQYFDINQILEKLLPVLEEENLTVMQPLSHINGKPALRTIVVSGEEAFEDITPLPQTVVKTSQTDKYGKETKTKAEDPQKSGSSITYFRRYALQSLFLLQAEDDDANKASSINGSKSSPKKQQEVDDLDL